MATTALEELMALGKRPGATEEELAEVEAVLGPIPAGYRALLRRVNGLEGFVGKSYVVLWNTKYVLERTVDTRGRAVEYDEPCPTELVIGSNGASEQFGVAMVNGEEEYVMFPLLGTHPDDTILLGHGLEELAERFRKGLFSHMPDGD